MILYEPIKQCVWTPSTRSRVEVQPLVAESASEDGDWAAITQRSEMSAYGRSEEKGTTHEYFALMPIAMGNGSLPSYYTAMRGCEMWRPHTVCRG